MDGETIKSDKGELSLEFLQSFIVNDRVLGGMLDHSTVEKAFLKLVEA